MWALVLGGTPQGMFFAGLGVPLSPRELYVEEPPAGITKAGAHGQAGLSIQHGPGPSWVANRSYFWGLVADSQIGPGVWPSGNQPNRENQAQKTEFFVVLLSKKNSQNSPNSPIQLGNASDSRPVPHLD